MLLLLRLPCRGDHEPRRWLDRLIMDGDCCRSDITIYQLASVVHAHLDSVGADSSRDVKGGALASFDQFGD